jgi:hypothetical protein
MQHANQGLLQVDEACPDNEIILLAAGLRLRHRALTYCSDCRILE